MFLRSRMRADNNFNIIRLLAAGQVLIVHALNHLEFSGLLVDLFKLVPGVPVFFFVSGMLITASYERLSLRKRGLRQFFINRLLRIYPALWVCVLLSLLVVWLTGYFETKSFGLGHFVAWVAGQLTFVQFYNPDFMRGFGVGVLNGALWTISVELQFYALTPVLFWLMMRRRFWFFIVFFASMIINVWLRLNNDWSDIRIKLLSVSFLPWVYMFMTGALAHAYRDRLSAWLSSLIKWRWTGLLMAYVSSMVFIGSYAENSNNAIHPIAFLLLCLLVFQLSTAKLYLPSCFEEHIRTNDYSYGLYIYHTPVLNVTLYLAFLYEQPGWQLAWIISIPIMLAVFSWHFVEERSLALKGRL